MHKSHIITPLAYVSSALSVVFSVFLAVSVLSGHVGAGLLAKTLAVALALVFEGAKFGFAAEAVYLLRERTKMVRTVGITCGVTSALLFALSTASSVAYVARMGGELKAQGAMTMQKAQHAATQASTAVQAAKQTRANIEREREAVRREIASTQDAIDRDIETGYRTRATQGMAHVEHLKMQLRVLDDREVLARKEEAQATQEAAQAVTTTAPQPVPADAMAGVIGVMLEVVSLLSVVVASMQRQTNEHVGHNTTIGVATTQQTQQTQPHTLHTQALDDVPAEIRTMPNVGYRAIAEKLGCTHRQAREIAKRVKDARAQIQFA